MFKHIQEVRAGHSITFTRDKKVVTKYWNLESKIHTDSIEDTSSHILSILQDTVKDN